MLCNFSFFQRVKNSVLSMRRKFGKELADEKNLPPWMEEKYDMENDTLDREDRGKAHRRASVTGG